MGIPMDQPVDDISGFERCLIGSCECPSPPQVKVLEAQRFAILTIRQSVLIVIFKVQQFETIVFSIYAISFSVKHPSFGKAPLGFFAGKPIHFAVQERSGFEARSVREMMFGLKAHHMTHMAGIHWLKKVIRAYMCKLFV